MGNEPIDMPALAALVITISITGFLLKRFLGKRHIQDRLMLRRLRVAGVKFDEPQNVGFIVFVKTEAQAGTIAERFRGDGFDPTIAAGQIQFTRGQDKKTGPQNGWLVTLNRSMTIDPEEITRLRPVITEAAEGQAGLYLGWQVRPK